MNLLNLLDVKHPINRLKRNAAAYALFGCLATTAFGQKIVETGTPIHAIKQSTTSIYTLKSSIVFTDPFKKMEAGCAHTQLTALSLDGLLLNENQRVANDFIVSANTLNYTVKGLSVNLLSTTAIEELTITFFEDQDGVPGEQFGQSITSAPTSQTVFKESNGFIYSTVQLTLPKSIKFPGNGKTAVRYWMEVSAKEVTPNTNGILWELTTENIIGKYNAFSNTSTNEEWRVGTLPAFRNEGVFTLDAICDYIVGCFQPSDFKLIETLGTKASFSWNNANESINKWNFAYVPSGQGIGKATIVTTTTPNYIVDLEGGQSYDFFVQSVCDENSVSEWSKSITVNLDYCIPTSGGFTTWITKFATTGAKKNITYAQNKLVNEGYDKRTDLIIEQYAGDEVSFTSSFNEDMVGIGIWADWNKDLIFDKSDELLQKSFLDYNQKGAFKIPENTPAGTYRMRIRAEFTYNFDVDPCNKINWGSAVDVTIIVLEKATCPAPSELKTVSVNQTTAKISWKNNDEANQWVVEYGIAGFTPGQGTKKTVNSPVLEMDALTASTTYDVYVQTSCADLNSTRVGPYKVSTLCEAATIPYVMNFETSKSDDIPVCTTKEALDASRQWIILTSPGYGFNSKTLSYVNDEVKDANAWFYTQGIILKANVTYTIAYRYGNNSTETIEKLKIAIGNLPSSESMNEVIADHKAINQGKAQNNEVKFTPKSDGIYYVGFHVYSDRKNWNLFVDDITVDQQLGINEVSFGNVKLYPNPTKEILNISSIEVIDQLEVYNLVGQKLIDTTPKSKETTLKVNSLPKGTYVLIVTIKNKKQSHKFIVQ